MEKKGKHKVLTSAGLTTVANAAIAAGTVPLGSPRSIV